MAGLCAIENFTPKKMKEIKESRDIGRGVYLRSVKRQVQLWRMADKFLNEVDNGTLLI